jgi:chaperonin GroEL
MPVKTILYQLAARTELKKGIDTLAKSVASTLGPKGRNVVLGKKIGTPFIINDGVTIAKEIYLNDHLENTGIFLIRQAALQTNKVAGDGTTTSTVLAYAIIEEGIRNVAAGANPIILKRGIEKATELLIKKITINSRCVTHVEDLKNVALIASGNDRDVHLLIGDAYDKVGRDGLLSVEEGWAVVSDLDIAEGLTFETGFISGYFVTDKERLQVRLENAYVLLTDQIIINVKSDLLPTLEVVIKTGKPLVIVSGDVQKEALATLILNKMKGILSVVAVKVPGFGDRRDDLLADLSILTGGQVISVNAGLCLQNLSLDSLGIARKVIIGRDFSTIISDENARQVLARSEQLRRDLAMQYSDGYDKDKVRERYLNLSCGVAVIRVGGATNPEIKDRKLRVEDAVNATVAANEEGVVPGGGATLLHLSQEFFEWSKANLLGDELIGALIVEKALSAPFKKIVSNSGKRVSGVVDRVKAADFAIGYDPLNDKLVNMFDSGIIDPVRVTCLTLKNAASIASMVLTTEGIIVEKFEKAVR